MSMSQLVAAMNTAFGNPPGNPQMYNSAASGAPGELYSADTAAAWTRLQKQCENIGGKLIADGEYAGCPGTIDGEVRELLEALEARNVDAVRDALCDIMVFALGAYHFLGYSPDADMVAVVEGVMSRFCKDQEELARTRQKYIDLGLHPENMYVTGEFPRKALKVAVDCTDKRGEHYPAGKFLKSVGYRETVFPPPPPAPPEPHPLDTNNGRRFLRNYQK